MEKVKIELECAKESYELGKGVQDLVEAIRVALSDGWNTSEDLPAIITAAVTKLAPAIQGADKVSEEAKETPEFVNAIYASLAPIVWSFVKK